MELSLGSNSCGLQPRVRRDHENRPRIAIWWVFSNLYGPYRLLVPTTVSLTLVGVVLWGSLVGSILPVVLRRLGFGPATSSASFVVTIVDVTGLVIYFSVGFIVLRGTLL